ncbi:DUF3800 domain-containing protein [Tabrizicola sp.]|uniref:DUF3800 domain-containing protein n=1 Tax=Tabrizicola sp. TaxID=2005166 RepID=UPI001A566254|nr:DUF3800 domain-containing protein [Tabrizicola sp.]MBL9073099.1 DUF3800 domain-containing protein [Tabrizicola sp.]
MFIDESGEAGISKVRTDSSRGASPYFVLGAAVFQPASEIHARTVLAEVKNTITKKSWRHATELDHAAKVLLARRCSELHGRFFAVVSNKSTLGEYKDLIESDPQKFYNKCLKYLLELICSYLQRVRVQPDQLSVILEHRNHDYDAMYRYLSTVKENPLYEESKSLSILNVFAISPIEKGKEELLEYADFVSHAVYQLTNKSAANYGIPEPRYSQEMSKRFAADTQGKILGSGIKCIHSLDQLELNRDIVRILEATRADPRAL